MKKEKLKTAKKSQTILFLIIMTCIILISLIVIYAKSNIDSTQEFKVSECNNCNVILISLDVLRADHMSLYGYNLNTTPNMNKLAKKSLVFNQMYANGYFTLPNHMSLMTGVYPLTHKINWPGQDDVILSPKIRTLTEILKENNYNTIWVGESNDSFLGFNRGMERGFKEFHRPLLTKSNKLLTESNVDKNLNNLNSILRINHDNKFFLSIHTYINHYPYFYPEPFNSHFTQQNISSIPASYGEQRFETWKRLKDAYENNITLDKRHDIRNLSFFVGSKFKDKFIHSFENNNYSEIKNENIILVREAFFELMHNVSNKGILEIRQLYDNGVYYADYVVGRIFDDLKQQGLLNNTIIIITSDHGEGLYEHGELGHDNFYDYNIHIPLIIYLPGLKNGIRIDKMTQSVDIMPTLLQILNISTPTQVQGKNILEKKNVNDYVYGYSLKQYYVKNNDWKLIINFDNEEELYNLINDPEEQVNLVDNKDKKIEEVKEKLENELLKWKIKQNIVE